MIVLLFAVELAVFIVLCNSYFRFTPDDGFIYLYGARQLASGHIPNYTPGEPATNAFGSQLWLALLSLSYLLSVPALIWGKILGIILLLASAFMIGKILLNLLPRMEKAYAYAASFTVISIPFFVACAVNLLDTMLAAFALLLSVYATILVIEGKARYVQAGLALSLLLVSRPDAFLGGVFVLAVLIHHVLKDENARGRAIGRLLVGLLPSILIFTLTYAAYKQVFPNSASAKIPGFSRFLSFDLYKNASFLFLLDFARDAMLYLIYFSLIPFCFLVKKNSLRFLFISLSLVHLAVFLIVRDWMGIHRLYLPSIAVAFTAFLLVLISFFDKKEKVLLPLFILAMSFPMGRSHWKYHMGYNYAFPDAPAERMGLFIAEHKLSDSYLLTCDMGVVPYFASIPTIDTNDAPICNRWLRKHPGDLRYVFNHNVDFIIMINSRADGKGMPVFEINEKIFLSEIFRKNYFRIGVATWRPTIEDYKKRGFSIGYGRYFHLYVSKRILQSLPEKKFMIF